MQDLLQEQSVVEGFKGEVRLKAIAVLERTSDDVSLQNGLPLTLVHLENDVWKQVAKTDIKRIDEHLEHLVFIHMKSNQQTDENQEQGEHEEIVAIQTMPQFLQQNEDRKIKHWGDIEHDVDVSNVRVFVVYSDEGKEDENAHDQKEDNNELLIVVVVEEVIEEEQKEFADTEHYVQFGVAVEAPIGGVDSGLN